MATIQSSEIAMHYGQHFVPVSSNQLPGVLAVSTESGHQYTTSAPLQQYGRQSSHQQHVVGVTAKTIQNVPAEKPTILNHALPPVTQNPVLMKIEAQPVAHHVQQQQHKMWLLVEWEMPAGEGSTYSVIDSSELVLASAARGKETIHTGKSIFVKRGNKVQLATVVIISDDKQFIDTELSQLRKMAAENLHRLSGTSQDQNHQHSNGNLEHQSKRRRTDNQSHDELEPVSPEYEPMPVQSHVANWVNNCKPPERVISPSPSIMSMHVLSGPAGGAAIRVPPPMTFDQQTQTDAKFFPQEAQRTTTVVSPPELAKILSLQESILAEQKSVRMENEYNRKLMFDMMEKLSSFAETLQQLTVKVESSTQRNEYKYEITEIKSPGIPAASNYVVLGTGGEESRDQASSESYVQRSAAIVESTADNLVIDQIALQHDDSNMSLSQSRFSAKEDNASNASTPKNQSLNFSKRFSASALSLSNASVHSQHSSSSPAFESNKKSVVKDVLSDWAEDDGGDESELTPIGPNNTMVKKQVLRAINWNNYKAATRKLLMTLFTREKLASHTLTGRPSPAFMGDRAKPVKDKLDQTIIADIISIITRSCNVSEPMVRTAITTKCADENKMSRMKVGRTPNASTQRSMTQFVKDTSSPAVEHHDESAPPVVTSTPASSHPKRIKRENKENVH
uniref:BEN domain-containing protein n=1 Tax=Culex tarsalis TaxID=7177 RepID=A0A1Q3EVF0_CULTA